MDVMLVPKNKTAPLVDTTKQKYYLKLQEKQNKLKLTERITDGLGIHTSFPMGGGPIEQGGDGTNFAGGVTVDYWEWIIRNLSTLRSWLNRDPKEGIDFPSSVQMEKARKYAKIKEGY